jgi:hypothetical protein
MQADIKRLRAEFVEKMLKPGWFASVLENLP